MSGPDWSSKRANLWFYVMLEQLDSGITIQEGLEPSFVRVVAGAVVRLVWTARGRVRQLHVQLRNSDLNPQSAASDSRPADTASQLVADFLKGFVQLRQRLGVVIFAARTEEI